MCQDCTDHRNEIKADLVALLMGDPDNRLTQSLDRHTDEALPAIHARIDEAIEDGRVKGDKPSDEEIREALRDCLLGAVLATGAAAIASITPGYTDEGKQPRSMILCAWAAAIMESEIDDQMQAEAKVIKNLLGMGDN